MFALQCSARETSRDPDQIRGTAEVRLLVLRVAAPKAARHLLAELPLVLAALMSECDPPPKPPVLGVAVALPPNPANAPPLLKGDADAPGVPPKGPALALADAAPKAPDPPKGLVICAPTPPKGPLFCAPKGAVLCAAPNAADPPNVLEFGAAPEPPDPPNGPGA